MKKTFFAASILIFSMLNSSSFCQSPYPDTLWVPVTFYDFHSNRSNPEFECDHNGGVYKNMVLPLLDSDKKPVLGNNPFINYYIKYWYRDWADSAKGDFTIPVYDRNSFVKIDTLTYDTTFKNFVMYDSLPFQHIGNGMYSFNDDDFFPLDGRGFGNEGRNHNYSFTMELHHTFVKMPGMQFSFMGDDDMWVFVNDRLTLDIGGIHPQQSGAFRLDTIQGLANGNSYSMSFFFAERHTFESHIRITTNMVIMPPPDCIEFVIPPDDTLRAGDTLSLIAQVYTDCHRDSARQDLGEFIHWSIIGGRENDSCLFPKSGSSVALVPTEAYSTIGIEATFNTGDFVLKDTVKFRILPGNPHHLVIEASPLPAGASLQNDQPLDSLRISAGQSAARAYAVLRDRFGNFVSPSKSNLLSGSFTGLISAKAGDTSSGEIIIDKIGTGRCELGVQSAVYASASFSDNLTVITEDHPVTADYVHGLPVLNRRQKSKAEAYDIAGRKQSINSSPANRNSSGLLIRNDRSGKTFNRKLEFTK